MRPTMRLLALLVPALLMAAACGSDDSTGSSTTSAGAEPTGLVADGTLTVCSDTPYEPFEFKDDAGLDTGYDIDLLRAIADTADLKLPKEGDEALFAEQKPEILWRVEHKDTNNSYSFFSQFSSNFEFISDFILNMDKLVREKPAAITASSHDAARERPLESRCSAPAPMILPPLTTGLPDNPPRTVHS